MSTSKLNESLPPSYFLPALSRETRVLQTRNDPRLILRTSTDDDNSTSNFLLFLRGHFLTTNREVFNLGAFLGGLLRGLGGHV